MKNIGLSRRGFLKSAAVGAGAVVGTRLAGGGQLLGQAHAAPLGPEKPAILVIHLVGGFNSLFVSADSLMGKFGITAGNHTVLPSGVGLDNTWANSMSAYAKGHLAAIGVRHGISAHTSAQTADWTYMNRNSGLILANSMGGTASIKAAIVGSGTPAGPHPAEGDVSLQNILDMKTTIDALGGGTPDPKTPDRTIAAKGITESQTMSQGRLGASPTSLTSLREGYGTVISTLNAPVQPFSFSDLATAYGLGANATAVNSFASKMAAAELMITAGSNVVMLFDGGWDTHGDSSGTTVRNKMTSYVLPSLNAFLNRMVVDPTVPANSTLPGYNRNVAVCIFGDFARSLPGSDHQPNLTSAVIGRYVKAGTTGKTDGNVGLPAGCPSTPGWWAYLSAIMKNTATPFGANPHSLVLP